MKYPKLELCTVEVLNAAGEEGVPYDEAMIMIVGDDDSTIELRCPGALPLAMKIVELINNLPR